MKTIGEEEIKPAIENTLSPDVWQLASVSLEPVRRTVKRMGGSGREALHGPR